MHAGIRTAACLLIVLLAAGAVRFQTAAGQERHETITVFAAASYTEAFTELGRRFERSHPGTTVVFNFAGSQVLLQELRHGAAGDIFAPASPAAMKEAMEGGYIDTATVFTLCTNRLVVVLPADNRAGIGSLRDLAGKNIKIVLAQKEVPVGAYAAEVIAKCGRKFGEEYAGRVAGNVVSYEENVKAIVGKVRLGEADAGFVYQSDAATDSLHTLRSLEIPPELNVTAVYPIGMIGPAGARTTATAFLDFCRGPETGKILRRFGFLPAPPDKGKE